MPRTTAGSHPDHNRRRRSSVAEAGNERKEAAMHALLITFSSTVPPEAIADDMTAYADALGGSNGLVSKAWLHDGDTLGGFYVFRDAEAASAYLASDLVAGMQTVPVFSGFQVRRFDLLDDLGAKTGVPAMAA
jgi:Putative mono-oxygenase ydhR